MYEEAIIVRFDCFLRNKKIKIQMWNILSKIS